MDDTAAAFGHFGPAAHGARTCHAEIMIRCLSVVLNACGAACFHSVCLNHPHPFPFQIETLVAAQSTRALSIPTKMEERNKAVTKIVLLTHTWHDSHLEYCYNTDYDSGCPAWGMSSAFLTNSEVLLTLQICEPLWVARTMLPGPAIKFPRIKFWHRWDWVFAFCQGACTDQVK